jgi:multidrug efflux pump subunit AcrB
MVKPPRTNSLRERFNISRLAIANPWLTLSFWLAVTVAGLLAFSSLKYALFPDITFPVVVVNATAPFETALETESKLTKPIEQQLRSLKGLDEVRSSTYPSQTAVSLSFQVGTNLETSKNQVETALKQLTLPKGATFKVIPLNLNESAVISYAIESTTKTLKQLTQIAQEEIVPPVAQLPGVLKVELLGAVPESTQNSEFMSQNSEFMSQNSELRIQNSGIRNQNSELRTQNPEFRNQNSESRTQNSLVRFNGKDALAIQVIKSANANTLDVVSQVEKAVQKLRSTLPQVQLTLATTQAEYIREATQATIDALAIAIALSVLIIFPFLWNWKATLISALAIPTSLLGTFIVMATFGFNLETITLLALTLVIGIIVDDAIVDVENIVRHLEEGEFPRSAAISATNEIGLTVTAATLTIVAVFLPVGLMGGVVGQFFKPFGLTVSAAVITSLLVARTLSPLLAVYWLKPQPPSRQESQVLGFVEHYREVLYWSLTHRRLVLGLAGLSFVVGIGLIPLVPKGFIPELDRGEFNVVYTAGATTSLSESRAIAEKLETTLRRSPQIQSVFTIVGSRQGEANKGNLYIKLRQNRTIQTSQVQHQLRKSLPVIPNVTTSVEDIQFVDTGSEKPVQIALLGEDLTTLNRAAKEIKTRIEKLPGFADVTATGEGAVAGTVFEIERLNQRRVAYIGANLTQGLALGDGTNRVVAEAKKILPPTISLDLGGDSARVGEIFGSFGVTLGLSVLCILLVLIWLFKSWVDPLAIIFSLPLSLAGAMLALLLMRSDFGIIAAIGIIFLLGLTNKNAILLIDYINQLRKSGLTRNEAILKAGPVRLRPILMTTAATILGMLPIALGIGAGSELRSPMAIAIIGGLIVSTLLSLIVVPVVYTLLDDWQPRKH